MEPRNLPHQQEGNLWFQGLEPGGNVVEEHRRRVLHQVNLRKRLRDTQNPFDISVSEFVKLYRIPQPELLVLVRHLRSYFMGRINLAVAVEIKVLTALAFFASGSYQRIVGRISDISVSQSSVSNYVSEVVNVLNHPEVLSRFIHFPLTEEERERVMRINRTLGFPRVLGFIDATLVQILPLPRALHREVYYCRKGYTAINAQIIICDANLYILNVVSRFPGSANDRYIWSQCAARNHVVAAYHAPRCWLLGDSGYMQEPWLMVPLPHAEVGTPEFLYTAAHCHCRNAVERCIGVLKGRWRCLLTDRTLHYFPEKASWMINACCVLHNFYIMRNVHKPNPFRDDIDNNDEEDDEDREPVAEAELAVEERQFLIDFVWQRHQHNID